MPAPPPSLRLPPRLRKPRPKPPARLAPTRRKRPRRPPLPPLPPPRTRRAAAREAADAATAAGEEEEEQAVAVGRFDTQATLRIGYPAFPASLDPNTDQGGAAVTNTLHFDFPFAHDKGRQWLASGGHVGWEFVDQNTAAVLTVQPDVFFHNGEQLNAERLKWFYERNLGIAEYNPDYVSGIPRPDGLYR